VFAYLGIEFFHFEFPGHGALVLTGGVKVPGSCARHHFDFISHRLFSLSSGVLDFGAFSAHIGQYGIDAAFVDNSHAF